MENQEKKENTAIIDAIKNRVVEAMEQIDQRTGGWPSVFWESYTRFRFMRGLDAAASLAYYALFSLFPLTLLLATLLGIIFQGEAAYVRAVAFIRGVFPFSGELINRELRDVFSQRSSLGVVGIIGLIWAASGFFNVLAANINRAWPKVKLRGYVQNRLVALGMIGALIGLLVVSILSTTFISLLPSMFYIFGDVAWLDQTTSLVIALRLASVFITYLTFVAMYRWVPNKDVDWSPVLRGALLATVVWEAGRLLFTLFLSSGLARYQFVYGSLSALIALMVWIYFGNVITLYGAYFVATLDLRSDQLVAEEKQDVHSSPRTDWKSVKGVRG